MNKKFTPYLFLLFLFCLNHGIFGQDFTLKIIGKDSLETNVLNSLSFQRKHSSEKSIYSSLDSIQNQLKREGYFTSLIEGITHKKNDYTAKFSLGIKTEKVTITIPNSIKNSYKGSTFTFKDSIHLKANEVEYFIESVVQELDEQGKSFSEITLVNPKQINSSFTFQLKIKSSKARTVNNIVIKGYEQFPKFYLKNHYKIDSKTTFSKKKLQTISNQTKSLPFLEEIKPPEVLFKKDSTILYLFLRQKKISSVDGIINFATKDNSNELLINGNLDLKLNNVLHTGESFELFWNRIKDENSEFRISTRIPYIFRSSITPSFNFNIYRQDSTFLNTKVNLSLDYRVNSKSNIYTSFSSENSNYLLDEVNSEIKDFSNYFIGVGYSFILPSQSSFYNNKLSFQISTSFGNRNDDSPTNTQQHKVESSTTYNILTSKRSYIYLKNSLGYLASENFLFNELFRIGGANSLRGFNEQSIFTDRFTFFNTEYRYLVSNSSYLYTIGDIGFFNETLSSNIRSAIGIGIGYSFRLNSNLINLGYVIGKTSNTPFDLDNSKLIISWNALF